VIRELPPLRLTIEADTPSGKRYRWAADAHDARDKPSGLRFTSTMPGGFENLDVTLARESDLEAPDLERLTTVTVKGAGGDVAGEYRLERAPRVSGDQMAVTPSAVGWQAALTDDKSARLLGLDRDHQRWQGPSRQRQINLIASSFNLAAASNTNDATSGEPSIDAGFDEGGGWQSTNKPAAEGWYDAGELNRIGQIKASWTRTTPIDNTNANWVWRAALSTDDVASSFDDSGSLRAAGPGTVSLTATTERRFAYVQLFFNAAGGTDQSNNRYSIHWTKIRVIGDHDLTVRGSTADTEGFFGSDLVAYIVGTFAPALSYTEGLRGTIRPSTFIIPQFAYLEPTTAGELVRQATRFGLEDWAVWDKKTFYWHPRGELGREWRARASTARLEETGPQVDRVWESVIVQYRDVDGSTRTVGPPGSGAGTEDDALKDSDPENPANKLGITRRDLLQAGTLTAAGAIEIGRRFLEQTKLLDSSGRATITGHVLDSHGVLHPYWRIRAGDRISFVDAAETGNRRIARASHDAQSHTCSIDLDAPPDALDALLERLGVALVPLGL
jgi:hypothetical protein